MHAYDEVQAIIDPDGKMLDPEETAEYAKLLWDDGLIASAFRYSDEYHESIDPERSLYDFFEERAQELFLDQPDVVAKRKRRMLLLVARMWGAFVGMR